MEPNSHNAGAKTYDRVVVLPLAGLRQRQKAVGSGSTLPDRPVLFDNLRAIHHRISWR